jgi:citrate synthase
MSGTPEREWLRTDVGQSTSDSITLRGHDVAELMGTMSFSDVAFLIARGRRPSQAESTLFNAVLISLADHGLTPIALAARLTYTGAPEALQGAVAAGLLGGGSVFLGPVEDTARFLDDVLAGMPDAGGSSDDELETAAANAVRDALSAGRRIPGLGHPIHKVTDPRTPRLYELADETGLAGPRLRLLSKVATAHHSATGRALPINGAGAAGAVLADLGFAPFLTRGFALLARTAGLIAHLAEEADRPIGMRLWKEVDTRSNAATLEDSFDDPGAQE